MLWGITQGISHEWLQSPLPVPSPEIYVWHHLGISVCQDGAIMIPFLSLRIKSACGLIHSDDLRHVSFSSTFLNLKAQNWQILLYMKQDNNSNNNKYEQQMTHFNQHIMIHGHAIKSSLQQVCWVFTLSWSKQTTWRWLYRDIQYISTGRVYFIYI